MSNLNKLLVTSLILLCLVVQSSLLVATVTAEVQLDMVLTTNGLDEAGQPVKFQKKFKLDDAEAVQYFVTWQDDNEPHQVVIKWLSPEEKLINQVKLINFTEQTVRSYISLQDKKGEQLFIPRQPGQYQIELYIDQELLATTTFHLIK
ncbi:MAG: hypothetical protein ACQEQI_02580 [Bacillota bacterium]